MHLLSVDAVTASVEGRTLFADVTFGLTDNDRVGVVGPNGSGKTTLLRIIAGDRPPDSGRVVPRRNLRIAWLPQSSDRALEVSGTPSGADGVTAREVVAAGDPAAAPDGWTPGDWEVEALVDRLGIDPDQPVATASGGQRRRIALARSLLPPSDLLVLDEPTNHLDVDAIDWLEEELRRRACGLVLVTHDRYVLERSTNRMLDLDAPSPAAPAEVRWHDGPYSALLEARAEQAAQRERATLRSRNLLRKEIAWLRRGPRARTSKPKFRLEQVESLRQAAGGDPEAVPLALGTGRRRLGNDVFELTGVTVTRGGRRVLEGVDLGIGPGERVAVVGPNGSGKTTLLEVLAGRLAPDAGEVRVGTTVQLALYEQEARATADDDRSLLDTVVDVAPHIPLSTGETVPAHRLAERFGFDARMQRAQVSLLSGGERRRLALLHVLVAAPNVLLLDEPTNDLDLDTLAVLEDHLDGFAGTLVVASHDRYLLDRLTDRVVAVEAGTLTEFLDWDAYRAARAVARPATRDRPVRPDGGGDAAANRDRQRTRRELRSVEQRLRRLTARRDELHAAMAASATDHEQLDRLQADLAEVDRELATAEDAWLHLTVD